MSRRRSTASYDESDVRVRPGKGSRPRSKLRPAHENARPALVVAVDRGRYTCRLDAPAPTTGSTSAATGTAPAVVTAMRARELGRKSVVVGDRVGLVGDTSGEPGTLARVVRVDDRATVLRRTADDDDPVERVVVANADQLMIVTAVADPEPRARLIDRCLVAAFDAGMDPVLCLTKADLADPRELTDTYAPLDVPTVVTAMGGAIPAGLDEVHARLSGRVTVLVGHSGVGKSTLVNALVPGTDRATGDVNAVTGRGRHTSTSAVALALPGGGWVVDTPGIRSFGLAHVDPAHLILAFPDLAAATDDCPRGCTHAEDQPECALDVAVAEDRVSADRVTSFRRLLASRDRQADD